MFTFIAQSLWDDDYAKLKCLCSSIMQTPHMHTPTHNCVPVSSNDIFQFDRNWTILFFSFIHKRNESIHKQFNKIIFIGFYLQRCLWLNLSENRKKHLHRWVSEREREKRKTYYFGFCTSRMHVCTIIYLKNLAVLYATQCRILYFICRIEFLSSHLAILLKSCIAAFSISERVRENWIHHMKIHKWNFYSFARRNS